MATKSAILGGDKALRLLIDQVTDYAIFLLTPTGEVSSWNRGAERIKGYKASEIVGRHFRVFYPTKIKRRESRNANSNLRPQQVASKMWETMAGSINFIT